MSHTFQEGGNAELFAWMSIYLVHGVPRNRSCYFGLQFTRTLVVRFWSSERFSTYLLDLASERMFKANSNLDDSG
jgi:hypothetical protein